MNPGLVSVIIPAFEAERHLRQALNSVLAQTYQRFEVIVVDDGSTDATCAVVEPFVRKDARIRLLRQANAGAGAARNAAIGRARGQYIAPLDADDFWFPEKLERQVACLEQSGPDTGLAYCGSVFIDEEGGLLGMSDPQAAQGRMRHALVLRNLVGNASAPLIRAAAFRQVGLYLTRAEQGGAQGCEDWDLYLRIAESFKIRVVPDYLVAYRQTGSSMSVNAEAMAASFGVTLRRARERGRDLPSAAFRWSAGYFFLYLAQKCHLWGHYGRCLRYLNAAVWANPPLLLKTAVYRSWLESLWLAFTRAAPPARPLPEGKANGVGLPLMSAQAEKKCPFISNALFERLELARWSAAWNEGD